MWMFSYRRTPGGPVTPIQYRSDDNGPPPLSWTPWFDHALHTRVRKTKKRVFSRAATTHRTTCTTGISRIARPSCQNGTKIIEKLLNTTPGVCNYLVAVFLALTASGMCSPAGALSSTLSRATRSTLGGNRGVSFAFTCGEEAFCSIIVHPHKENSSISHTKTAAVKLDKASCARLSLPHTQNCKISRQVFFVWFDSKASSTDTSPAITFG